MNKEEIKDTYSMHEIVERYGFHPNRSGFISCPFHKEKTASMKIYKDSYYCFGCGESGDIFTFIMNMDNLTFKEAFSSLGGTCGEPEDFSSKLRRYRATKEREMKRKQKEKMRTKRQLNNILIDVYRKWYQISEPFSQTWTDCYNALQYQLYLHELLNGEDKAIT